MKDKLYWEMKDKNPYYNNKTKNCLCSCGNELLWHPEDKEYKIFYGIEYARCNKCKKMYKSYIPSSCSIFLFFWLAISIFIFIISII